MQIYADLFHFKREYASYFCNLRPICWDCQHFCIIELHILDINQNQNHAQNLKGFNQKRPKIFAYLRIIKECQRKFRVHISFSRPLSRSLSLSRSVHYGYVVQIIGFNDIYIVDGFCRIGDAISYAANSYRLHFQLVWYAFRNCFLN